MPQLKQLSCCIQWSDTGAPFQEHGTLYGDGVVETFIIVPNKPQGFSIRLTSRGFIAEGIVMIVFIDGNYQCNRNRVNLLPPAKDRPTNRTEIDFLLRQKEKPQGDGIYLGREWRFDSHNIVAESPAGFQESHFDDLGLIEVLVLRCRARDREDADYEGSSSGEESDIFGERPPVEQQESMAVSAPTAQASATPEPPAEEADGGLGLFGCFDGANDAPNLPNFDGGNDVTPGRWIWHQSHAPFAGVPEPPQYHQPEGHRFRAQSYAQPPIIPHPQPCHDRRSYSGQSQKRVHFDYGHPAAPPQPPPPPPPPQQHEIHREYSQIHQPQPQRPASRVRERRPSKGSQTYHSQPYDPQNVDRPSNATEWHDAPENHQSKSPRHGGSSYTWGYGSGNSQRSNSERAEYTGRSRYNGQSQTPPNSGGTTGQQPAQRKSSGPRQNNPDQASATNTRTSPAIAADQNTPRQNTRYNAQAETHRNSSAQSRRSPHPEPIHSAAQPEYTQHRIPSNEMPRYPTSSPHAPVFLHYPYPYPHPPQMQHGYHYAQVPYPGYWSGPFPHTYDPDNAGIYSRRHENGFVYPPHMHPPGSAEQISPTNTYGNTGGYAGSNGSPNDAGYGQEGSGGQQDTSGNGDVNQSWQNDTNNDNGNNNDTSTGDWNGNQNDKDDATDSKADNFDWDNKDNNGNAGDNNDNNGTWGDSGDANNKNDWNNDANDTQAADNGNGWDVPANNDSGNGTGGNPQSPTVAAHAPSDVPRDLYGPHGPYYALRGLRISEPRPDAEEEPRFDVPKSLAVARGSTKQVQPGPGYRYYKKRTIPEYIDSLDNPYARFVFKYRTKDQLLNEIGIEVDVEPTGDAEIQDLQNLDKQALIEMLMRAKSALGGRVPSPPPTPSTQGSEVNAPVAIEAPKHAYLKYSLPPLRPNNVNAAKPPSSATNSESKQSRSFTGKKNDSGWNDQGNNNGGGGWNTENKDTTNTGNWNSWDGAAAKGSGKSSGSQRSQHGKTDSWQSKKASGKGTPPRPITPPQQKDSAEHNWDSAAAPSEAPLGGW